MKKDMQWEIFKKTGKIADYLKYVKEKEIDNAKKD